MYKAIKEIGGYKLGDVVPDEKAKTWLTMYKEPHVEEVKEIAKEVPVKLPTEQKAEAKKSSSGIMASDYLARGVDVVIANIRKDPLDSKVLAEMLKLEKEGKNRQSVIGALEKKIKETE